MTHSSDDAVDQRIVDALRSDRAAGEGDLPADVDDGLLLAHREGRLDREDAARVRAWLHGSEEARALYAALGDEPRLDQLRAAEAAVPRQRRRWPLVAIAAALLLGIGVAVSTGPGFLAGGPTELEPPETAYALVELRGQIKHERGAEPAERPVADERPRFDAAGTVELRIAPRVSTETPDLAILVARRGGPLREITRLWSIARHEGGGLTLRARAAEVFAGEPGAWTVLVVLGEGGAELLEGRHPEAAESLPDGAVIRVDASYVGPGTAGDGAAPGTIF